MYILFDIGGTKIRFSKTLNLREFDDVLVIDTPVKYQDAIVLIKKTIDEISRGQKIKVVSGGIAGMLDVDDSRLLDSPNLQDWIKKPLVADLKRITGAPVYLFNDAELGGMGEAVFGSGHEYDIVAYLTISTGIGGSLVINKQIVKNANGFEPGHQILDYKTGETFENLLGGNSLEKKYNKKPKELPKELYKNELKDIAVVGIYNLIRFWSPEVVVLGGSQMNDISIEDIKMGLDKINKFLPTTPDIVKAKLGDQNGLYGAMALLKIMGK